MVAYLRDEDADEDADRDLVLVFEERINCILASFDMNHLIQRILREEIIFLISCSPI